MKAVRECLFIGFRQVMTVGDGPGDVVSFVSGSTVRSSVLELLSKRPTTPTEAAKIENKHVSHISRTIRELEQAGLVEFVAAESRQKYYRTTQTGYALLVVLANRTTK